MSALLNLRPVTLRQSGRKAPMNPWLRQALPIPCVHSTDVQTGAGDPAAPGTPLHEAP